MDILEKLENEFERAKEENDRLFELFKKTVETKDICRISLAFEEWSKSIEELNHLDYLLQEVIY